MIRQEETTGIWTRHYGVATVSRIDKNIGLFCKRDLYKRQHSAEETYNRQRRRQDRGDEEHVVKTIYEFCKHLDHCQDRRKGSYYCRETRPTLPPPRAGRKKEAFWMDEEWVTSCRCRWMWDELCCTDEYGWGASHVIDRWIYVTNRGMS